jgi:hypothetical protein
MYPTTFRVEHRIDIRRVVSEMKNGMIKRYFTIVRSLHTFLQGTHEESLYLFRTTVTTLNVLQFFSVPHLWHTVCFIVVLCWTCCHHITRCSCHLSHRATDRPHVGDSCRLRPNSRGIRLISWWIESNSPQAVPVMHLQRADCNRQWQSSQKCSSGCSKIRIAVCWPCNAVKWHGYCRASKWELCSFYAMFTSGKVNTVCGFRSCIMVHPDLFRD